MSARRNDRERFDYDRAKARIFATAHHAGESLDSVFSRRAAELAVVPESEAVLGAPHLIFEVSGDLFAVALEEVTVALKAAALDAVPFAPSVVDRVLLVQGHFVSVYDLALRAGRARTAGQVVIVLRGPSRLGIRADAVHGLGPIDPSALVRPLDEGGNLDSLLHGITSERVQVIDVAKLGSATSN